MRKILLVTEAVRINARYLDFACFLCSLTNSQLLGMLSGYPPAAHTDEMYDYDNAVRAFLDICGKRGINSKVYQEKFPSAEEVIRESRYADLILIEGAIQSTHIKERPPARFLRDILTAAACPVMINPLCFRQVDEIIFTFDGSRSSVFAIKQFIYLFPGLYGRKACILNVITPDQTIAADIGDLSEWVELYYCNVSIVALEGVYTEKRLLEYLLSKSNAFVVMGAYGRSKLSVFFSPSHAAPVIRMTAAPVFIAHC